MDYIKTIDRKLLKWAYQRPFKNNVFIKTLIFIGDGPFWMILVFLFALVGQLLNKSSFFNLSILLILGLAFSNIVFTLLKNHVKRMRPYANEKLHDILKIRIINRDPGHGSKALESFPSGHVLWTTLCVLLISYNQGLTAVILFGWMIPAMMFLRPYLGVHYPSDTLAGLVLGCIGAAITISIFPMVTDVLKSLKGFTGYTFGYWCLIAVFLIVGFKSWLKRV